MATNTKAILASLVVLMVGIGLVFMSIGDSFSANFSIYTLPSTTIKSDTSFFITGVCDATCASNLLNKGVTWGSLSVSDLRTKIYISFNLQDSSGKIQSQTASVEKCSQYSNRVCAVAKFGPQNPGNYKLSFAVNLKSGTNVWTETKTISVVTPVQAPVDTGDDRETIEENVPEDLPVIVEEETDADVTVVESETQTCSVVTTVCPYGNVVDASGCPTSQCKELAVNDQPSSTVEVDKDEVKIPWTLIIGVVAIVMASIFAVFLMKKR